MKAIILKTLVIGTAVGALAALAVSPQANAQTAAHQSTGTFHPTDSNSPTSGTSSSVGSGPTPAGETTIVQSQPPANNNNSSGSSGCCGMGGNS